MSLPYRRELPESDPVLQQVHPGTFEPVVRSLPERPQTRERKPITKKVWGLIGASALAVTALLYAGNSIGYDAGAHSRDAEVTRLQADKAAADRAAEGAQQSADFLSETHRVEAARTAFFQQIQAQVRLPKFNGQVQIFFGGAHQETLTDPVILSPNYGAVGKKSDAEGWQAIVGHSPESTGGIDVFVRDSPYNTYKFISDEGVELSDTEVWSAKSQTITFDVLDIRPDFNGVPEIVDSNGMLVGMSTR